MKLSKTDLEAMHRYEARKNRDITFQEFVKNSWKRYTYVIVIVGGLAALSGLLGLEIVGAVLFGIIIGILYGDYQWYRMARGFWPVQREIIDWVKVRQMIDENEASTQSTLV